MKFSIILSAILITFGWITSSKAQLIEAQNFDNNGDVTFNVTLTTTGPINVIAESSGGLFLSIDGMKVAQGQGYNGYISVLNYETPNDLSPGNHTVSLTGGDGGNSTLNINGAATLIALNEPSSGAMASSSRIQSQITALQNSESDDATNIGYLQSIGISQSNQLNALQTNEKNDAAAIAALQSQLTTVQSTLQGEINSNTATITDLQSRLTADETTSAQQQAAITALQNQSGDQSDAITALQQQQQETVAQQQADEANLSSLQTQLAGEMTALSNLQTQLAQNQATQAAENIILQNQITALQAGVSSAVSSAQINSLQTSLNLTRRLTYVGAGLGAAGICTGIGIMAADGDFESEDSSANDQAHATNSTTSNNNNH